jgi:xylose isomerase
MDICARGLKAAEAMIEDGGLDAKLQERYQDWSKPEALEMLGSDFDAITMLVLEKNINPQPRSGNQEILENYINRFL